MCPFPNFLMVIYYILLLFRFSHANVHLFFDAALGPTIMQVLGQLCSGRLVLAELVRHNF